MTTLSPIRLGLLLVPLALAGGVCLAAPAPEPSAAATRQYAAAANLQNLKSYDLAAEAWQKFLAEFQDDPRVDQASYNLGVCYYLDGKLDQARATFQTVVERFPKLDKLEAAYLYLGAAQYGLARAGQTEMSAAAVRTLDTLLEKFPAGQYAADALYYRGECLYMGGKKEEAVNSYRQLIDRHPKHTFAAEATYALGVCYEELNRHEEAGKTYEAFLKAFAAHPLAPEVSLRWGQTLFAAGKFDEAARRFAAAAAATGFKLADLAAVRQADALAQMSRYVEAAALYEAARAKFPKSEHAPRAVVAGGKCYYLAGKYAEARKLLADIVSAGGPASFEAAHWIARSWLQENQPAKALESLARVIPQAQSQKSPMAAQLLMDQADAAYEIPERKKDSIGLYAAAAAQDPKDPIAPQALYMAGFAALEQGEHAAALKHADAFLGAHAGHELAPDVMHVKAESHLLLEQFPQAQKQYGELLQKYPNHADAALWRVRRGLALQLDKKYRETIDALQPAAAEIRGPDLAAEARYLVGISQLELNDYAAAVASLEASIAAQPKWRQADETLLALARAYRETNDLGKAKAALARLIAEFPESKLLDKAHYRLGECAYVSGDFQAAAAAYQKLIDGWPQSPLAPYAVHELGCAKMDLGDNAAAEQLLGVLLEKYPKHDLARTGRLSRGMARHRLQKYAPAIEDLQAFLAADPAPPEKSNARYLVGLCQMGLRQYEPAAATFQALLEEDPKYTRADEAMYQWAWALKLSGKGADAAKSFQQLAAKYPESSRTSEAYFHVGEFMYEAKDYKQAAIAYYKAMQQAGKSDMDEKSAHKLGWSYYHQDQFDNARKTFRYQLTRYPEGPLAPDAAFMEAECLFKQDQFEEALAAFEQVQGLANEDFEMLRLLHAAQAAAQQKQWPKSIEMLQRFTERFPNSPYAAEAYCERGWAHQNLKQFDQAIQLYEKAIGASDGEVAARAQFLVGEIQFQLKDHKAAVKSFIKVAYGYSYPTWQAEATFEAARCFEVLERPDQAVKLYGELIEKYPASPRVPLARQKLEELTASAGGNPPKMKDS